ncbi:MAG: hypothetical protein ACREBD_18685 [Blastocatellia bacterium]
MKFSTGRSSIAPLGSHYVITLEAIHGQIGESLETEQVEARSKEQALRALSQAATRLRAKLGESLSSIQRFEQRLEETTTPKLEAFQAYSLGYEQTLSGRLMDAIQLYRRAVELGQPGLSAEYAEKAYALKDRVSDYEQLQITFRYHFMGTGDVHKALEAATLFKRMYPRTFTAPIDLLVAVVSGTVAALCDQFEIVNALANRDSKLRRIDDPTESYSALLPFLGLAQQIFVLAE